MSSSFNPNWATPPGSTISDVLSSRKIQLSEFAISMGTTVRDINELISGNSEIDSSIAQRLSELIGGSVDFWVEREQIYRAKLLELNPLEAEKWIKDLPIHDMIRFGWISETDNLLKECLNFFGVTDLLNWRKEYLKKVEMSAFRTSKTFDSEFGALATWLRQGEVLAESVKCSNWNPDLLERSLNEIRGLSRLKSPKDFLPRLKSICSDCGVAVIIVRTPSGCRASGATKFVSPDKAILQLSFRYLSDDHFWFTFFHEVGHLMLHSDRRLFIEKNRVSHLEESEEEIEANLFAQEALIPHELEGELIRLRRTKRDIIGFAMRAGISPGIVIGQLQHRGIIRFEYLNAYKRRYNWDQIE